MEGDYATVNISFNRIKDEKYGAILVFGGAHFGSKSEPLERSLLYQAGKLARWMVLNRSYLDFPAAENEKPKEILAWANRSRQTEYYFSLNGDNILLHYPPLAMLPIEESRLARKIVISLLYNNDLMFLHRIVETCDFPEPVIERELQALTYSDYVTRDESIYVLTMRGREYYEQQFAMRAGTVFIVASCTPHGSDIADTSTISSHAAVLTAYKKVTQDVGLVPVFQEEEEPRRNIYIDIFDYIDTCDFVIGDLTWERPNCYIEIGYAMARNKPILLFIEEQYFQTNMKGRVPFDLGPVKYQTYFRTEPGLDDLTTKLRERVGHLVARNTI